MVDGFEERTSTTRLNGADAVSFSIKKQSGANTAAIAERVHATLARVSPSFPALQIRAGARRRRVHPAERGAGPRAHHLRRHDGRAGDLPVHARLALDADQRAGAADVGHRHVLLHVDRRLHLQHDDADGAVARHRHPHRRRRGRAREHLPAHGAGRRPDDGGAASGTSEIGLGGDGDDLHHPGRVPAGWLHDRPRRPVLQVVRADDRLRGRDVAARRLHARPDAVVALRPLHPARGAHAHARRPAVRAMGPRLRRARPQLPPRARLGARQSVEDAGRRGAGVRRQPRHHDRHGHRVRAGRGPRRVPGHRRPAAGYVVRRERGDACRAIENERRSRIPEVRRSSAPLASTARCARRSLRVKTTKKDAARARHRRDQGGRPRAAGGRCRSSTPRSPTRNSCRARRTSRRSTCSCAATTCGAAADHQPRSKQECAQIPGAVDVSSNLETGQPEVVARVNRVARRRSRLQRRQRRHAAARDGRRHRAHEAARRRPRARHPRSPGAGVPQRPRGHPAHAALLARRRCGARRRRRRSSRPRSARATSTANSGAGRRRSASTWRRLCPRRRDRRGARR